MYAAADDFELVADSEGEENVSHITTSRLRRHVDIWRDVYLSQVVRISHQLSTRLATRNYRIVILACTALQCMLCKSGLGRLKALTVWRKQRTTLSTFIARRRQTYPIHGPQPYPTRKPSWRKGYARQRRHFKMAVSRHLGFYRTANSAIRSADREWWAFQIVKEFSMMRSAVWTQSTRVTDRQTDRRNWRGIYAL